MQKSIAASYPFIDRDFLFEADHGAAQRTIHGVNAYGDVKKSLSKLHTLRDTI